MIGIVFGEFDRREWRAENFGGDHIHRGVRALAHFNGTGMNEDISGGGYFDECMTGPTNTPCILESDAEAHPTTLSFLSLEISEALRDCS